MNIKIVNGNVMNSNVGITQHFDSKQYLGYVQKLIPFPIDWSDDKYFKYLKAIVQALFALNDADGVIEQFNSIYSQWNNNNKKCLLKACIHSILDNTVDGENGEEFGMDLDWLISERFKLLKGIIQLLNTAEEISKDRLIEQLINNGFEYECKRRIAEQKKFDTIDMVLKINNVKEILREFKDGDNLTKKLYLLVDNKLCL